MVGAVILVIIGVVGMLVGYGAKRRTDAMAATTTVDCADVANVAREDEAVPCEVVGTAEPGQDGLAGPLSGTSCVWYRTTVSRRYRDRRRSDSNTRTRTRVVSKQASPQPLTIRDSSGTASVLPDGAKVVGETKSVDRFEPYGTHGQPADGSLTQRAISIGLSILTEPNDGTLGYEYREWIIRDGSPLYVRAGAMRDHTGRAWLQKPAKGPFLVSTRSETELTRRTRLVMFGAFALGAALIAGGVIWAITLL